MLARPGDFPPLCCAPAVVQLLGNKDFLTVGNLSAAGWTDSSCRPVPARRNCWCTTNGPGCTCLRYSLGLTTPPFTPKATSAPGATSAGTGTSRGRSAASYLCRALPHSTPYRPTRRLTAPTPPPLHPWPPLPDQPRRQRLCPLAGHRDIGPKPIGGDQGFHLLRGRGR